MTHARSQIRGAIVTALTGLTTTGSRVHAARMRPTDALPCLLVETNDESIDTTVQTMQMRGLTVTVRASAKIGADVDVVLDTIAEEVEAALHAAGTLGNRVPGGLALQSISTDFDDALEQPAGALVLTFSGSYFTAAGSPGTFI